MNSLTSVDTISPEKLLTSLLRRLKRHALSDSLLIFLPPLAVIFYLGVFSYRSAFLEQEIVIGLGAVVLGAALAVGILRHRSHLFSLRFAARLVDAKAESQDRFVTLATVDRSSCPSILLDRLQQEAAGLLERIHFRRDFPYRLKRSFIASAIASLSIFILFQLVLEVWPLLNRDARAAREIGKLAREMSRVPALSELGRKLDALAVEVKKKGTDTVNSQPELPDLLKQIEAQLRAGNQQGAENGLLGKAAEALQKIGSGSHRSEGQGGGELKANVGGEGEGKEQKSSGIGKGEDQGQMSRPGESVKGGGPGTNEKQAGPGKSEQAGGEKTGAKPDGGYGSEGKARGESGRQDGRSRPEEIPRPQGAPPDRFVKAGEQGDKGLKGARFVTVQLPEEETGGSATEGGSGTRRALRPKVPVSNMPLRGPDSPDAPPERQPLPLEYRELIR